MRNILSHALMVSIFVILIVAVFSSPLRGQTVLRIQDIQSDTAGQYTGQEVTVLGIVTAASGVIDPGFYIQDSVGAYSGVLVYTTFYNVDLGDSVRVTGPVEEYYGKTEISFPSSVTVLASGCQVPPPTLITTSAIATSNPDTAEMFEGVLVGILQPVVTDTSLGYGEWEIDDGSGPARVDDAGPYTPPLLGDSLAAIVGIVDYSFDNFKLQPRGNQDIYYTFSGAGEVNVSPNQIIQNDPVNLNFNFSTAFGEINEIEIILPGSFDFSGSIVFSGSGFLNAGYSVSGDTISINGAEVSSIKSGTCQLTSVTAQNPGIETLYVFTASSGDTLSPISTFPIIQITRADGSIPISLVRANTSQGVPLLLGENVVVTGIMTAAGELGGQYFLEDGTGGVCVYNPGGGLSIGDSGVFQGTVDHWNGLTELSPSDLISGPFSAQPIVPEVVTCSILELEGTGGIENYEGRLVRIDNLLQTVPVFPQVEQNMPISDGTGDFELRVLVQEIAGKPVPPDGFSVTGIISQYCPSSPYTSGYQIMPRSLADIRKGGSGSGFVESYLSSIIHGSTGDVTLYVTAEIDTIDQISFEITDTSWHWSGSINDVQVPSGATVDSVGGNGLDQEYQIYISNLSLEPDSSCFITIMDLTAPDSTGSFELLTKTGVQGFPNITEIYNSPQIWSVNSIWEVQQPDSGGYNPILLGQSVVVAGVVTGPSSIFNGGTTKTSFWIEDTSSGVNIFSSEDDGNQSFVLGAEVIVRGVVTEYNGITEIVYPHPDSATIVGLQRPLPDTLLLQENQGIYELIEGRLIMVKNAIVTSLPVQSGSGKDFEIRNGRTIIAVRLTDDADLNTDHITVGNILDVIGIAGQYSYDTPPASGYQLLPRFNSDLMEIHLANPTQDPQLTIYPNPVSITAGEIIHIFVNSPLEGTLTLKIFDMEGREVATLLENTASGPQYITWDGLTNYGFNARIGVYIVHLKYKHNNGDEEIINKPLVVGTTLE